MTCLVTLFDRKLQVFKNFPKLTILGIFSKLLSTQNVNVARFACNVECDLFVIFKHCGQSQKITDEVATNECNDVSNDDSAFIFVIIP